MAWWLLAGCLALVSPGGRALADTVAKVGACLKGSDLSCARARAEGLDRDSIDALRARAWIAFHEGRYDDAVEAVDALEARGVSLEEEEPNTPYRATAGAARNLEEARFDGGVVRHGRGVDRILAEEGVEVLARSRTTYDQLLGGGPDYDVVLDIYPTATRFIDASGLPPEAVRTTGVVALSKWSRLLLTSPRALQRGYGWKDTVAHEYIHLVVALRTGNRAPVWLQEGLAKFLEGQWRGGRAEYLSVHQESLLAGALRSGQFVPFEKFRLSMAYLDSGEEAALAFAQVATMVAFLVDLRGDGVLTELLDRVRDGQLPEDAVADLAGYDEFEQFKDGWKAWIRKLPLVEKQLAALPVVLDGEGDDFSSDPLLAERTDLARFVRIGDLLRAADRPKAALIEYQKAEDPTGPPSPTLLARKAQCHMALDQADQALALAQEGVALYPEYPLLQVTLGRLLDDRGDTARAVSAWTRAHDLNPYDPEVQRALVAGHVRLGQDELAARHARYLRILETGGAVASEGGSGPE